MFIIFLALGAGIVVGFLNLVPQKILENLHHISTGALLLLLFSMGARLGSDQELMGDIGRIGLESLGLALSAIIGSCLLVYLYEKLSPSHQTTKGNQEVASR